MTSPARQDASRGWLWAAPDGALPAPPVETRAQLLPFSELDWKNFERLCLRLAAQGGEVEECLLYGVPGQGQQGIDVLVRLRDGGGYEAWQCKRYQSVLPADIHEAIDRFLGGSWAHRAATFCFAASSSLEGVAVVEEIEEQTARLRGRGIAFVARGQERLSTMLKPQPRLVDDFFGREWVRLFCGADATLGLSRRSLTTEEVRQLRSELRRYYAHHFEVLDPGLPLASGDTGSQKPLAFIDRYVAPDVRTTYEATVGPTAGSTGAGDKEAARYQLRAESVGLAASSTSPPVIAAGRKSVFRWLVEQDRSVLLGEPGTGKSSLARFLILELLSEQPTHLPIAARWDGHVPVWIPFGMWAAMVAEVPTDHSVPDAVMAWVRRVGTPAWVADLLLRVLDDERAFLIVDGLDEATNETAARTAMTLLETFVAARGLPALVTSRPYGYRRLGGLGGWVTGELEELSFSQQRQLAMRWLRHFSRHRLSASEEGRDPAEEDDAATEADCEGFIEELKRDPPLARLAANPLLLTGLIALRLANVRLPRSRFKAYTALLDLLLQTHPRRRERARLARSSRGTLTEESRARALAKLAFETHRSADPIAIQRSEAIRIVASHLGEELGRTTADIAALAEEVVLVSEGTLGVLVQRSAEEVTFFHRLFQEVLAARHVLRMAFEEQRRLTRDVCQEPHWREVLLCVFSGNERPDEVEQLVLDVEATVPSPAAEGHQRLLIAEAAFGDFRTPFRLARRLAEAAFGEVQRATWAPTRQGLLDLVVGGLDSDAVRGLVLEQLRTWFPDPHPYRGGLYAAMAAWTSERAVVDALWNGLYDENDRNREAAARALVRTCGDDPEIRKRLVALAQETAPAEVTAVALRALSLGWRDEPLLRQLLLGAAKSPHPGLRVLGISARVERGEHGKADLTALMELLAPDGQGRIFVEQEAVAALATGWPADEGIRRIALRALEDSYGRRDAGLTRDAAVSYLLLTAPQDDEVASYLATHFRRDDYPSIWFNRAWALVAQNFGGHRILVPAVDDWLERRKRLASDAAEAARITRSDRARAVLLEHLRDEGGMWFWAVDALLEGWPADAETLNRLRASAEDPRRSQYMAHALPRLFPNAPDCRRRLLSVLLLDKPGRIDFAVRALRELGSTHEDQETLELVLRRDFTQEFVGHMRGMEVVEVIRTFGADTRVREIALSEVDRRFGELGIVADTYGADAEVRRRLLRVATPLPANLRTWLVERLQARVAEDPAVSELLSEYDQDVDGEAKVAAAIAHYEGMLKRGEALPAAISRLSVDITATWMDMEERRQAALAGLISVGRLDIAAAAKEHYGSDSVKVEVSFHGKPNRPLVRHLAEHWLDVEIAFGDERWTRLEDDQGSLLEHAVAMGDGEAPIGRDLLSRTVSGASEESRASALRLLARCRPGDPGLKTRCLALLDHPFDRGNWFDAAEIVVAAEIVGEQYGSDPVVAGYLEGAVERGSDGAVIALAIAKPGSQALAALARATAGGLDIQLLTPAWVSLAAAQQRAPELAGYLRRFVGATIGDIWEFLPTCRQVLVRRLSGDEEAYREAVRSVLSEGGSGQRVAVAALLASAQRLPAEALRWCEEELSRQVTPQGSIPELAVDVVAGYLRPVGHILLDIVSVGR